MAAHILEASDRKRVFWQGRTFSARRLLVDKNMDLTEIISYSPSSITSAISHNDSVSVLCRAGREGT